MMCYSPSGYIISSLRKLKFYGGWGLRARSRELDVRTEGRITQTTLNVLYCIVLNCIVLYVFSFDLAKPSSTNRSLIKAK